MSMDPKPIPALHAGAHTPDLVSSAMAGLDLGSGIYSWLPRGGLKGSPRVISCCGSRPSTPPATYSCPMPLLAPCAFFGPAALGTSSASEPSPISSLPQLGPVTVFYASKRKWTAVSRSSSRGREGGGGWPFRSHPAPEATAFITVSTLSRTLTLPYTVHRGFSCPPSRLPLPTAPGTSPSPE
jgi:hypothetical protein